MKAYKFFFMQNVDWTTPFMTFTVMAILLLKYIISTGKQNRLQISLEASIMKLTFYHIRCFLLTRARATNLGLNQSAKSFKTSRN